MLKMYLNNTITRLKEHICTDPYINCKTHRLYCINLFSPGQWMGQCPVCRSSVHEHWPLHAVYPWPPHTDGSVLSHSRQWLCPSTVLLKNNLCWEKKIQIWIIYGRRQNTFLCKPFVKSFWCKFSDSWSGAFYVLLGKLTLHFDKTYHNNI